MPAWKDSKVKGPKKWCCSFYYEDWKRERKRKTKRGFLRKKDAEEWENEFLAKFKKSPSIPLFALCENYFEDMSHDKLKITTFTAKRERVKKNILPYLGNLPINTIEPLDIINWQNEIKKKGYEKNKQAGYSPTYLRTIHNDLSSIMNYAVTFYGLRNNPCRAAGSMGSSRAAEMKIWTLDQFEAALQYEDKPGTHLILNLLFWSGIREGEALALTPDSFLPDYQININKNYAVVNGTEYLLSPKNNSSVRTVAIPPFIYDEAMDYIHSLYGISPDDKIFYFTKNQIYREIKQIADKAGLEKIRVHDLRHSHASLLIEMGFNILSISKRLGHSSVKITWDTYGHLYPDKDQQIAIGLHEVKSTGITQNATTEAQLLQLLMELKKEMPYQRSQFLETDNIIVYDPIEHVKEYVTREKFYADVSGFGDGQEIMAEMMDAGYYELAANAVYCFESCGMPIKYL